MESTELYIFIQNMFYIRFEALNSLFLIPTDYNSLPSLFFKCNRLERHLKLHHDLLEQLNNLVQDESSKEFEQVQSSLLHDVNLIFSDFELHPQTLTLSCYKMIPSKISDDRCLTLYTPMYLHKTY